MDTENSEVMARGMVRQRLGGGGQTGKGGTCNRGNNKNKIKFKKFFIMNTVRETKIYF